jgi:[acyl-carrier-protein] S-malonyltransferase
MGRELAERFPCARRIFEEGDRALGFSLSRLCFDGPADELQLTANTQPAVLTVSVAAAEVLRAYRIRPDFVAGHSLGEYSAAVVAGGLGFDDAIQLVRKRGQYMQEAVPVGDGAMAALLGIAPVAVEEVCREAAQGEVVSPANLNSPGQVVIAGHAGAVARAAELAKARGAKRAVMLSVSAPFHCALMKPAQERLAAGLDAVVFSEPHTPVVTNVDAQLAHTAAAIRDSLNRQVTAPVRWEDSMRLLLNLGVEVFVEVGPGKVLSGLLRQVDRDAQCLHAEDTASVEEVVTRLERGTAAL